MTELTLQLPPGLVDAIADAVAAKLAGLRHEGEEGEPWRLWTLAEVCDRLGRSERTIREWAKDGRLPRIQLDGGAYAFDPEDVKAFARGRRIPLEDEAAARRLRAVE